MKLGEAAVGQVVTVQHVGGERSFRRRLMELGLVPGTRIELVGIAPLGDPLELLVRGASLSIRRADAGCVLVRPEPVEATMGVQVTADQRDVGAGAVGLAGPN